MAKQKSLEEVVNYANQLSLEDLLKLQKEVVKTIGNYQKDLQATLSDAKLKLELIDNGGEGK